MPKLIIHRISEFENRARKIKIELNGELAVTIKNGETLELDIPSGTHTIQAKIDWCSSNLLELEANDTSSIEVVLSSGEGSSLYRVIFKLKEYLKLTNTSK